MNDDRLTPKERAVIEAADRWYASGGRAVPWAIPEGQALVDAVSAYRHATAPPEPFDGFVVRENGRLARWVHATLDGFQPGVEIWRCTVTPTERVR